jgi:hypothetical protein
VSASRRRRQPCRRELDRDPARHAPAAPTATTSSNAPAARPGPTCGSTCTPDGGIARLRVYGRPVGTLETRGPDAVIDLVAMENGGRAVSWNDASFGSSVAALLLPGRGQNMGDGWETRRRREPGNDWCVLELGAPGTVERIEVDTAFFKGNYPDRCSHAGRVCDRRHRPLDHHPVDVLADPACPNRSWRWTPSTPSATRGRPKLGPITHVRFNIFPDGGVSRLRLWGKVRRSETGQADRPACSCPCSRWTCHHPAPRAPGPNCRTSTRRPSSLSAPSAITLTETPSCAPLLGDAFAAYGEVRGQRRGAPLHHQRRQHRALPRPGRHRARARRQA